MDIKPTLVQAKGKWYVCVTVPVELRQSFKGQKQIKRSTGTSDKKLAEKRLIQKANEILNELEGALAENHPYVKAGQKIIDLTSEIKHGFSADQLLKKSTSLEAMRDIMERASYAKSLGWMGEGDPETAIGIAHMQERMEKALEDFEEQADLFFSTNKIEGFRLSDKPLISEVLEQWLDNPNVSRTKTINTYASHVKRFIKFGGDQTVDAVTKIEANHYVQHLVKFGLAHSTLETAVAAMRGLLNFAEEKGYVEFNSFAGLRLKGKGKPPRKRVPFTQKQLTRLFQLPMKQRDKLCLQILACTGMRLDEVALLTFDDIKIDEDTGIRFFDLTDEAKLLKNDEASRRKVPVPDKLKLPTGQGRLFNYPKDVDGKSQNAASKALLRQIRLVRSSSDQNLVVHSLRHTYKDMLRDAGVPKDLQDFLLGHAASSVGESYGQGYSLKSKKEAIDRLDLSFL